MTESEKPQNCECIGERMQILRGKLWVHNSLAGHSPYNVNFCPMCGQKVVRDENLPSVGIDPYFETFPKMW